MQIRTLLALVLVACSSDDVVAPAVDGGPVAACIPSARSNLAGVRIELGNTPCAYTLAQARAGITIPFRLVADMPLGSLVVPNGIPGNAETPLRIAARIEGGGQAYCLCDVGRRLESEVRVDLDQTSYDGTFAWDGVNWNGPSDTGTPKGAAFPAGTYTLHLLGAGSRDGTPFEVALDVPVTLR